MRPPLFCMNPAAVRKIIWWIIEWRTAYSYDILDKSEKCPLPCNSRVRAFFFSMNVTLCFFEWI
jgi:hypothetical protein